VPGRFSQRSEVNPPRIPRAQLYVELPGDILGTDTGIDRAGIVVDAFMQNFRRRSCELSVVSRL
jgi:hypothetical protein